MTEKELEGIETIRKMIRSLEKEIKELESQAGIGGGAFTGMPRGKNSKNSVEDLYLRIQKEKEKLINRLNKQKLKELEYKNKVYDFIENIPDRKVKLIIQKKYIDDMAWVDVGAEVGLSRTQAARKMRKFLANYNKNH